MVRESMSPALSTRLDDDDDDDDSILLFGNLLDKNIFIKVSFPNLQLLQ